MTGRRRRPRHPRRARFSTIAEPGVVDHTGGPSRFVFGELDGDRSEEVQALLSPWAERNARS